MNIAEDFESTRRLLEWTFQDLSEKLDGHYSLEYLKQVHRGEPYAEVSDDLKQLYVGALAEKAVDIVSDRIAQPIHVRVALIDGFIRFVHRKDLSLGDVRMLSEGVSSFRELLKDASIIEIRWEKVLEAIIRESNNPEQGRLIENIDEIEDGSTQMMLVSDLPMPSYQPKQHPQVILPVCNFCRQPFPKNRAFTHSCGSPNDYYL